MNSRVQWAVPTDDRRIMNQHQIECPHAMILRITMLPSWTLLMFHAMLEGLEPNCVKCGLHIHERGEFVRRCGCRRGSLVRKCWKKPIGSIRGLPRMRVIAPIMGVTCITGTIMTTISITLSLSMRKIWPASLAGFWNSRNSLSRKRKRASWLFRCSTQEFDLSLNFLSWAPKNWIQPKMSSIFVWLSVGFPQKIRNHCELFLIMHPPFFG